MKLSLLSLLLVALSAGLVVIRCLAPRSRVDRFSGEDAGQSRRRVAP
jgi:hypothetical protein